MVEFRIGLIFGDKPTVFRLSRIKTKYLVDVEVRINVTSKKESFKYFGLII